MKKMIPLVLIFSLGAGITLAQPKQSESIVVPVANLDPSGTLIDSTELPLATAEEMAALMKTKPASGYFCFPEDRQYEIRFDDALPQRWATRPAATRNYFRGEAQPGEFYPWQLGVFAATHELKNVRLTFQNLLNEENGTIIPASAFHCFNMGGVDIHGEPFIKQVTVLEGSVQDLWIGVRVPESVSGIYSGSVVLEAENAPATTIDITLAVSGEVLVDGGVADGWRLSRLQWLDSRIAQGEDPTRPYTSLQVKNRRIYYLGAELWLNEFGFPSQIETHYDRSNQLDETVTNSIFSAPVSLVIETDQGAISLTPQSFEFTKQTRGVVSWESRSANSDFNVRVEGSIQFDGAMTYCVTVQALKESQVKDIRMEFPVSDYASKYMMGLGRMGRERPETEYRWTWDTVNHQDKVWLGNINAGLNVTLKDENYIRPLVNIYYEYGRLQYPRSWGNEGRGGVVITPSKKMTQLTAYSGERKMKEGEVLHYNFDLRPTPVKPIDLKHHFTERFYHQYPDTSAHYIETAKAAGATLINIHHREDIYPFINYPFADAALNELKAFSKKAQEAGLGMRAYYTCRELTVKTPEFWALRSLGDEVVMKGPGNDARTLIHPDGPKPWLMKNLKKNYIPAWFNAFKNGRFAGQVDISIITTPDSRWNNYWLEGLNWMVENVGLMGIYVDDTSLDGKTMQRARRILDQDGARRLIDMHTWNHMNGHAGYANSIQLYFELLPYIDRMWIGELFEVHHPRDFWLVEMSAIPFGLMSETLEARNIYRGMTFGMLPRLPWSGNPVPMWRLMDSFDMADSQMYGYWDERNPLTTNNEQISATTYLLPGRAIVVMANWDNEQAQNCKVKIDTTKLGFTPCRIFCPSIDETQKAVDVKAGDRVELPALGGTIWIIE